MLYKTNEMLCLRSNQWPVHIDTDTELHTTVCLLSMHQRKEAGIDVSIFKAHSVRGASTTAPLTKGVSVADILHTAEVLHKETGYSRPIIPVVHQAQQASYFAENCPLD